jgi:transmembrane sensor
MSHSMRDEAVDWVLRLDAGVSAAEEQDFRAWLARHPDHASHYAQARLLFDHAGAALRLPSPQARRVPVMRRARVLVPLGLAACLALFVGADGVMRVRADAVAGTGERPVLALPDGSKVQLDSRAAIAVDFSHERREVRLLRGRAYFQVLPDTARPFTVSAAGGRTRALGTAFEVALVEDGAGIAVTEHAVAVKVGGRDRTVLHQGQSVAYTPRGFGPVREGDVEAIAAWRQGRLVANNATLGWVAGQLEQYVPGRILIPDAALRERRVSGSFDISDPQAALAVLEGTLGLRALRLGPYLTILR